MNETTEPTVAENTEESVQDAKQQVIEVDNPSTEDMKVICKDIEANYDFDVDTKAVSFNFKKSKDKVTGIETVRKSVELAIPYPSVDGLINIIEGKHLEEGQANKGLELLLDAMADVVNTAARELLYEDVTLNAASFPTDKVAWEFIANIPKVQRRGGGIPKETWESFAQDYVEVMPQLTGKTIEQVANAAKILSAKLTQVRTNEPVLNLLVQQLGIYAENSPNIEEYQECVAFLLNKAETFLNVTPEELLSAL